MITMTLQTVASWHNTVLLLLIAEYNINYDGNICDLAHALQRCCKLQFAYWFEVFHFGNLEQIFCFK